MYKKDFRKFTINYYFENFLLIDISKFNLKKFSDKNIYIYQSLGYKILNWKIKPKIFLNIIFSKDEISISIKEIKGLESLSNQIDINIYVLIRKKLKILEVERYIDLGIKKNNRTKFISEKIIEKILSIAIIKISQRFDKKLIKKIISY